MTANDDWYIKTFNNLPDNKITGIRFARDACQILTQVDHINTSLSAYIQPMGSSDHIYLDTDAGKLEILKFIGYRLVEVSYTEDDNDRYFKMTIEGDGAILVPFTTGALYDGYLL